MQVPQFINALKLNIQYGKQIGKVSKSGNRCFLKKGSQDTYTLLDSDNKLVRTKVINNIQDSNYKGEVRNAKGDVTSVFERTITPLYGYTKNSFAKQIRNVHSDYNKFGQVTHKRDILFKPSITEEKATIASNIDGVLSKTFLDTATNKKYTIKCVK